MDDATSDQRRCEVCGDSIHQDNTLGICSRTPECRTARNRKKRRSLPRPEPKTCEVCGRSIRSDNEIGICQRPDSPECRRARQRKAHREGPVGKNHYCEVCGRLLRRDNSMGVCGTGGSKACAQERDRRRGWRRGASAIPEGWTPPPYIEAGSVFGRLTVLEDVRRSQDSVLCRCECGPEKRTEKRIGRAVDLTMGTTRSCGCLRRELMTTHGLSQHPLYAIWNGIVQRTTNPKDGNWPNYGARGIRMCERWLDDPRNFVEDIERDIGPRPAGVSESGWPLYTLDRENTDGNYEPGNVKWSTASEQLLNRRKVPELAAQIVVLTAQLQALAEQKSVRKRRAAVPIADADPLF